MTQFGTTIDSLLSVDRILNLIKYSNAAVRGGYICELGVFRGGSLEILAKYNPGIDILAIDSFEGVPDEGPNDFHTKGDFAGVDHHALIGYFRTVYPAVRVFKKFIPEAFNVFDDNIRFSFTHVDLDMESSVRHSCDFIYPRTLTGGMILFDDYKVNSTPGATKAIDEFFADKPCAFKGELFYYDGGPSHKQYLVVI